MSSGVVDCCQGLSQAFKMSDNLTPMKVRKLTALALVIDGKQYRMSLLRSEDQPIDEFIAELRVEFVQKLDTHSHRMYNSVEGSPDVEDTLPDRMFDIIVKIPYQGDQNWPLQRVGTTGVIVVKPPRTGVVQAQPAQNGRKATNKRSQRKAIKVNVLLIGRAGQ